MITGIIYIIASKRSDTNRLLSFNDIVINIENNNCRTPIITEKDMIATMCSLLEIGATNEVFDKLDPRWYSDDILIETIYVTIKDEDIQFPTDDQLR